MKLNWIFEVSARKVTADSVYKFVSVVQRCNQKGGELSEELGGCSCFLELREWKLKLKWRSGKRRG
jgi:hypothetical protein